VPVVTRPDLAAFLAAISGIARRPQRLDSGIAGHEKKIA
jgi:hypothetical protein